MEPQEEFFLQVVALIKARDQADCIAHFPVFQVDLLPLSLAEGRFGLHGRRPRLGGVPAEMDLLDQETDHEDPDENHTHAEQAEHRALKCLWGHER